MTDSLRQSWPRTWTNSQQNSQGHPVSHRTSHGAILDGPRLRGFEEARGGIGLFSPEKTRIIYCKDSNRREEPAATSFDFPGFTFRPRLSKSQSGRYFVNFGPAVSNEAGRMMRQKARRWDLHLRSDDSLEDLSRIFSPIIRGWISYYGIFYKSAMYPTLPHLNTILVRWARRKFNRLRYHLTKAVYWLGRIAKRQPELFPHWQVGIRPTVG